MFKACLFSLVAWKTGRIGELERPRRRRENLLCTPTAARASAKGATLDDLRESVETLEDAERIAQRALGGAHPLTKEIEGFLQQARFVLRGYSLLPYGASAVVVAVIAWVWRRFLT